MIQGDLFCTSGTYLSITTSLAMSCWFQLLKHQKAIEELTEENEKLRQVLIKELKVSPEKFETSSDKSWKLDTTCADCFECRRRRRKSGG